MNPLLVILFALFAYTCFRHKRRRVYELAALIPSIPEKIPFFGALQYIPDLINNRMVNMIKDFTAYAQNNGGVIKMWIGPLLYVGLTNPDDIEYVLKNCLEKADVTKIMRSVCGNAGIFAPVSIWTRRRKLLIPAFCPKIINSFMDIIINQTEELAEQLTRQNVVGIGKFSIFPFISSYTLDSICETALGVRFNYLKNPNNPFLKATSDLFHMVTDRIYKVWLWPDWTYRLSPSSVQFYKYMNTVYQVTDDIIHKKKEELKDVNATLEADEKIFGQARKTVRCFLEHLILLSRNESGATVTDVELREEVLMFLLAGTDTTSIAICNTLILFAKYPKIQQKVCEEIQDVFGGDDRTIEKEDLKRFDYLERVIRESLRVLPPVPLLIRKVTEETQLPSGVILPADTGIIISLWGVNLDKKYWGPDADCFDPDRYLSSEKSGLFMPFSLGPRNCIGSQYALMSLKLALVAILRRYRVVGDEEEGPIPHVDTTFSLLMKASDNYQLALENR